jgi:hypothetical protein
VWEFDSNGKFLREIGKGVYGLGYAHSVRFDKYDNLWVVDKGTNSVMKFNPAGYVTMNLGRRPEGYEGEYHRLTGTQARTTDGNFNAPTDIGWDAEDNIYVSDGYGNSRVAKMNKNGDWIKSWGAFGTEESQFRTPHNLQVDKQGNVYVADRGNGRIQVFDSDGNFKKLIWLNAAYDKQRHPVLGNLSPNPPNATAPWALCITTTGPTQYLFAIDTEPGRLYKMTLEGQMLGMLGESEHREQRRPAGRGAAARYLRVCRLIVRRPSSANQREAGVLSRAHLMRADRCNTAVWRSTRFASRKYSSCSQRVAYSCASSMAGAVR